MAGLHGHGFSAKSFRPTGATSAIDIGCDPKVVHRLGWWKTESVFFEHYVHSRTDVYYTQSLLDHQKYLSYVLLLDTYEVITTLFSPFQHYCVVMYP